MQTKLNALSDDEFTALLDRLVDRGDRLVDPETGSQWPVIRGGAVDTDEDGDDEDDAEDDDDDGEDEEAKESARRDAKMRRSARKAARREMVRELGFGNVGALKDALAGLEADGSEDGEGEEESSDEEPQQKRPSQRQAVTGPDPSVVADLRSDVAIELASAGIRPEKVKRATKIVMDDLDPADNPSSDEIADVIDELRDEEAGWFGSSSSNDDAGSGSTNRGIPNPDRRGTRRKTSDTPRAAELFEARKDRHRRFELPTNR